MNESEAWGEYYKKTGQGEPRKLLVEAVDLVHERGAALDLGAGALNDTRFLLAAGFKKVVAVDKEVAVRDRAKELKDERLEVVIAPFDTYEFPIAEFDLINAQFSLPFIHPDSFDRVFGRMLGALKPDGVFAGQLFGPRDSWSTDTRMTFHVKEQVESLFSGMKLLSMKEEENDRPTALGEEKHWHIFHVIASKFA